jgi:hypothetical protein
MGKSFIRNPAFWIPSSVILLDWGTKIYFNLTLGKPKIGFQPFELINFTDIIYYPVIFFKVIFGQITNFEIFPQLFHKYVCIYDRIIAILFSFFLIISIWLLHKYIKNSSYYKKFYYIVAGASLANEIELMIFSWTIDWLRINFSFIVAYQVKNSPRPGIYRSATYLNLADILIYIFIPLAILFYLGHLCTKWRTKNESA